MVIAKAVNYRADGVKYPTNAPEGWVFMAFALETFGPAALEEGGSFLDIAWCEATIPTQNPALDKVNAERQRKARKRLPRLVRAFNAVMTSGEVKSAYSTIGGGGLTPIEADLWRTDDPQLRYRTFSIDPDNPFSDRVDLPCWIWIELESLNRAADRLYRERKGWGPLPEPPPLPRTETYLREDGQIETWHCDVGGVWTITIDTPRSGVSRPGRPNKTTRILKLFGDHLRAGTVAERVAWEGAAIHREYGGDNPPKAETCEDRIRRFYNLIVRDQQGGIVNAGAVLDAMEYPINPDKSLSMAT